jgi:hypothetical protein
MDSPLRGKDEFLIFDTSFVMIPILNKETGSIKSGRNRIFILLPRQGSNLNFPDPESGVLPITPRGKGMQS